MDTPAQSPKSATHRPLVQPPADNGTNSLSPWMKRSARARTAGRATQHPKSTAGPSISFAQAITATRTRTQMPDTVSPSPGKRKNRRRNPTFCSCRGPASSAGRAANSSAQMGPTRCARCHNLTMMRDCPMVPKKIADMRLGARLEGGRQHSAYPRRREALEAKGGRVKRSKGATLAPKRSLAFGSLSDLGNQPHRVGDVTRQQHRAFDP